MFSGCYGDIQTKILNFKSFICEGWLYKNYKKLDLCTFNLKKISKGYSSWQFHFGWSKTLSQQNCRKDINFKVLKNGISLARLGGYLILLLPGSRVLEWLAVAVGVGSIYSFQIVYSFPESTTTCYTKHRHCWVRLSIWLSLGINTIHIF